MAIREGGVIWKGRDKTMRENGIVKNRNQRPNYKVPGVVFFADVNFQLPDIIKFNYCNGIL